MKTEPRENVQEKESICLKVNGKTYTLETGDGPGRIEPSRTLASVLREDLGFTGVKVSCDHGACGCCTVLLDGKSALSCMTLAVECEGKEITTIEGLKDTQTGELDPIQQAFVDHTAFQCGFCTPGMIMSAKALLNENPTPAENEIKEALSGVFCRCISHYQAIEAVKTASSGGKAKNE